MQTWTEVMQLLLQNVEHMQRTVCDLREPDEVELADWRVASRGVQVPNGMANRMEGGGGTEAVAAAETENRAEGDDDNASVNAEAEEMFDMEV